MFSQTSSIVKWTFAGGTRGGGEDDTPEPVSGVALHEQDLKV
jgi:hypothetical protein